MSNIYEIIDSLDLKEEANKLQIYLIKNPKEEEKLLLALKSTYKTKEDKRSLMKDFLNTITDEHQARTKIKIMDEFPNGLQFIQPKPLLCCTGSEWTYQPAKTLYEELRYELKEHYQNFLQENFDKTYIRYTYSFPEFHRTAIACLSEDEDLNLRKNIENAFVFSNRARTDRMLKQLLPDQDLDLIISNYEAPLTWEVFELVSNTKINDKTSEFFKTLTNIHDLALRGTFVIPLCTATVSDPVESVLKITHRKHDHIIKMLVNDCGGHGRALEVLQEILKDRDIQNVNINDVMNDLRIRLRDRYCEALMLSPSEARTIARATLTRHLLKFNKHVPGTKNVGYFDLPYIWIWILTNSSDGKDPVLRDRSNENPTCPPGSQFWQHFEHFVASFRTLKSRNLNDGELTSISSIHIGARLNGDFEFKNHHLELECAVHQEETNSSNYGKDKKEIMCEDKTLDVRECKYCVINGASAPYGDTLLGLDVNLKLGKPNEVHQYKRWKVNSLVRNASNWDKYFGPYSGRAHAYANVGPLNINKASRRDLLSVYGIGEIQL
ncbi:1378_t:CDS:10 [Funneliformis caledonium]|uniref:1378_t:CDS:1 n=1 Tax=Funneliformis caledonium TaxID=1117310 RepID=A0A9N8YW73_9GLOM|nr:1378_t:CDS:10 [Funneliformis caledonium]